MSRRNRGRIGDLRGNPLAMFGLVVLAAVAAMALLGPWLAPYDPLAQDIGDRLASPSWDHPMGTDELGRDVLSRILFGASVSMEVAVAVVLVASVVGTALGFVAGYLGGWVDQAIMRMVDIFLAFPAIVLALVISAMLHPGVGSLVLALSITQWPAYTRLVRGTTLKVREMGYVEAARALRPSRAYVIRRHLLPNSLAPVVVLVTLDMATVIVFAAALSFLGLGIQPPTPEWGSMLRAGVPYLRTAPHVSLFPGLFIMLTVLAFNFLGDGVRDIMDPRKEEIMAVNA